MLDSRVAEALNLALRWFHVVMGIAWVGQTYLFQFMERSLERPDPARNLDGELWLVHGGGFFQVQKLRKPQQWPGTLHWFRWESMLTWLSGLGLLIVVYYLGRIQVNFDARLSHGAGVAIGLGSLVAAVAVYNAVMRSPLGADERVGGALCLLLGLAAGWGLLKTLSARAAYLHLGAMMGTIMVTNVWMVILPGQQAMLGALKRGEPPDLSRGRLGARVSKHNSYMSVPLVALMLSAHFPSVTHGTAHPFLALTGLLLAGFAGAYLLRQS